MQGRQGWFIVYVRTEPCTEKGVQTHQRQPDVVSEYRAQRTHWTQSPEYQLQDAPPLYLTQDSFLLINTIRPKTLIYNHSFLCTIVGAQFTQPSASLG